MLVFIKKVSNDTYIKIIGGIGFKKILNTKSKSGDWLWKFSIRFLNFLLIWYKNLSFGIKHQANRILYLR
jgi:hypothetical protein